LTASETPTGQSKLPVKGTLFVNRSSGVRVSDAELALLRDAAASRGLHVVDLESDLDLGQIIRERLRRGETLFIAAGGDGTVHHVLQSIVNTDAVLAVIPTGTYNHFARDLGIPLDWRGALDVAVGGATRQIDTGRINDRFFVNNVSLGLYPRFVAHRESRGRDYPRWKARLYAAYITLRKYPHVNLNVESEHHFEAIRTHVFMVSNNSYDLSRIGVDAPRDRLTEGRVSVYWLPHIPRWELTKFVARFLAGRARDTPGFRSFRTRRMRVQSSRAELKVGIDGEVFEMVTPLVITIVPQSLLVRVPKLQS
jgi:diacylglycerol kinase family enzyme